MQLLKHLGARCGLSQRELRLLVATGTALWSTTRTSVGAQYMRRLYRVQSGEFEEMWKCQLGLREKNPHIRLMRFQANENVPPKVE